MMENKGEKLFDEMKDNLVETWHRPTPVGSLTDLKYMKAAFESLFVGTQEKNNKALPLCLIGGD
jgi:hypothetical protein